MVFFVKAPREDFLSSLACQDRVTHHHGTMYVTFSRTARNFCSQDFIKSSPEEAVLREVDSMYAAKTEYGLPRWVYLWDAEMEWQTRPDCQEHASKSPILTSLTAIIADHRESC